MVNNTDSTFVDAKQIIEQNIINSTAGLSDDNTTVQSKNSELKNMLDEYITEPLKKHMTDTVTESTDDIKIELQKTRQELFEVREILKIQKAHKRTFYIGSAIGIVAAIFGLFVSNLLYIIFGIGILCTSLTGFYEAHQDGW